MTYGLFGKFSAQPGRRDDLVTYLLQAAKLLERNSNCIHYIVSTSDEPEAVWVCEVWTKMRVLTLRLCTSHMRVAHGMLP